MAKPKNPVQMAVIGAPHGVSGALRVRTFTGDPYALGAYGPLYTGDGRSLTVEELRLAGNVVIVRFAEFAERSAAEALNGTALYVDRSALPDDLEEDEFYHADLIGLAAVDEAGACAGRVAAVHDFGAGDVLELRRASGESVMIPFTRAAVPEVDIAKGMLRVDSVAAGLAEDGEAEGPNAARRHGVPGSDEA